MKVLTKHNQPKVIDLLIERLTFEREGVKLYDRVIAKVKASRKPAFTRLLGLLEEHRDEEKEHEEWLEEQVRALGGDAHAESDRSKLVGVEAQGIKAIIMGGERSIPHLLHALLAAELVDNAGWDLLVQLAEEADDPIAERAFKQRLHEEEDHLDLLRRAIERLAFREVLGERFELPVSP